MLAAWRADQVIDLCYPPILTGDIAGMGGTVRVGNGGITDDEIVHEVE